MPSFKSRDDDVRGVLSLKTRFGFRPSSRVKHPAENADKTRKSDKQDANAIDQQQGMPEIVGADVVDANPLQKGKDNAAVASGTTGTSTRLDDPASQFYTQSPPLQRAPAQVPVDRFLPPAPRKTPSPQLRRFPPRTPPPRAHVTLLESDKTRSGSAASTASSATMTPTMYPRRPLAIDSRQMQQPRRPPPLSPPPPMNQNLGYIPRPGQVSTAGFPPSFSSSSSAATGNSSSPTAHSSDSIETPPSLEPTDPSAKPSYEFVPPRPPEEFVAPSQPPGIDPTRAGPPFNHSHGLGPRDPHVPGHFGPLPASRAFPRPFRRPHSFEGLYFAQLSLNSRPPPEMVMRGPTSSQVRHLLPQLVQLECLERHAVMHKVHNVHHCIPCMACRTMGYRSTISPGNSHDDPAQWRFVCGWCSVRVCPGCKDQLAFQGSSLSSLLRVVQEKEGVPGEPLDLTTPGQSKAPLEKGGGVERGEGGMPVDLSEGLLPPGVVDVSTIEVRAGSPATPSQTLALPGDVAPRLEKSVDEGAGGVHDVPTRRVPPTPTPTLHPHPQPPPRKPVPQQIPKEQPGSHEPELVQPETANRPPPRGMLDVSSPAAATTYYHTAAASPRSLQQSTIAAAPAPAPAPVPAPTQPEPLQSRPPRAHEPPPTTQVRLEADRASIAGSLRKKWRMSFLKKKK